MPAPVRQLFDYLVPVDQRLPSPGVRVRVPFGRRSLIGMVMTSGSGSEIPAARLKPITRVLDTEPLLPPVLLRLLDWAAGYYHHPIGEVVAAALPGGLRRRESAAESGVTVWAATPAGMGADEESLKRAPAQRRVLEALKTAPDGLDRSALARLTPRWRAAMRALSAKGWVSAHRVELAAPAFAEPHSAPPPPLSPAQTAAAEAVAGATGFRVYLLHGVTGSGKTEVYLQAIARIVARGDQALLLVPEIGLTPQLVGRLRQRFDVPLVVLHSDLNDQERTRAWLRARAGKAGLVVGTRSAVFTPMPRLRLIVVDEEHDASYKQQDGFRYSARDLAVMRASREGIPVILGSATPSLESYHHARVGTYSRLALPDRAGGAALPSIELLDMRRLAVEDGLSPPLRTALAQTLERGEQALLFLNRRGFAPVLMCFDCAWVAPCERCDARLTLHRASARLRCHHCGAERPILDTCPACSGTRLRPMGEGTERVESALERLFPGARIVRIDRDSTRAKGALEARLARVRAGDADILIGTQMLSKGHDFPNVTLVGVLNADQGLYGGDFRSAERLVQQVIQVSGRAGRAARPGKVLIQTYHPHHPVFAALHSQDYDEFARYALAERREAGYPPYGYLALLRAESPKPGAALAFLRAARAIALACRPGAGVQVMEAVPSPMERRAGRYRAQLLVQAANRKPLHALLDAWVARLVETKEAKRVRWSLDVDPLDLY